VKLKEVSWEDVYIQLPDWSKNRVRFHLRGFTMIEIKDEPARTVSYGLYRNALIATGNGDLIEKYELDQVMQDLTLVRKLSEFMKKKGQSAEKRWRYLVDLHRLNDFIEPPAVEEFVEDIRDWVQRRPIHTWNGDEDLWYKKFEQAVRTVLFRSGRKPGKQISIDDFITNGDIWCTSGSGFEPESDKLKVYDKVRREVEEVKKNKWSVRWNLSNYKVKRLIFKRRKQLCKAVAKSEPAKVRAVISSDLGLYLKMTYISTFLDQILAGRTDSTLWMSADDRMNLWQDMKYDGTWRMPLDQSEFDKNVTMRQVAIMLKIIRELIAYYGASETMLEIMDLVIYALDGGIVFVGDEKLDIMNGVLSGWRWTALLDTICNLAEVEMADEWVRTNSAIDPGIIKINAQGDDDLFKLKTYQGAVAIWLAYESFGLGVNPGKFFLDKKRDEYLRRVMDENKITGYPARSVASILFRNPVNEAEPVGQARIRSTFGKWKLFAERFDHDLRDPSWMWRKFLQDAVQGTTGITKEIVTNFVKLGAMYGGIGYDCDQYAEVLIPPTSILEKDEIEILGEGYAEWVVHAERYGVDKRACNRFAVSTLNLEGRQGWPKWVKYILTDEELTTSKPHGMQVGMPGTVAVGKRVLMTARRYNYPWFPNVNALTHMTWFEREAMTYAKYYNKEFATIELPRGRIRPERLIPKEGVSMTLAQLSEYPELVYDGYDASKYTHVPKRWLKDWLSGKLKSKVGQIPGWGADVVGHFSKKYLQVATFIFLTTNKPKMHFWDSLLASIEAAVRLELDKLEIRVVE
jgi:hypothetical protein